MVEHGKPQLTKAQQEEANQWAKASEQLKVINTEENPQHFERGYDGKPVLKPGVLVPERK